MHDSDELDDILNEIRNHQNPHTEDAPPEPEPPQTVDMPLFDQADAPTPAPKDLPENSTLPTEAAEETPAASAMPETTPTADGREDVYTNVFSGTEETRAEATYTPPTRPLGDDEYPEEEMKKNDKQKKIIIAVVAVVVVIAVALGIYFGVVHGKNEEPTSGVTNAATEAATQAPVAVVNPFTGENDYNEDAVGRRPVALVVENAQAARPQWGINSPDIIVEGEVEGGETRMLWLFADYTSVPDKIGPMRSARPPYIRFSEMFDAVFIHWGQSKSKGSYVGANTVFAQDNVDHINQMTYSGKVDLFTRDQTRNVASEHTGVLRGKKIASALKEQKIRTKVNEAKFTTFDFNKKATAVGDDPCNALALTFSNRTRTRDWTYKSDDQMYHSTDYETDVKMKNLIVLFDNTSYTTKANYKGSGKGETYCNYDLAGGKGVLASQGTYTEIKWSKKDGKLSLTTTDGQPLKLNPGRSWIGYASANNGGKVVEK